MATELKKLEPATDGITEDVVARNIAEMQRLFPEAFTENSEDGQPRWKVDLEALASSLGEYVEKPDERYHLNWFGKQRAKRIAQTASTATLRPCRGESVNWNSTNNIFIEGDNLEVLKTLQKSYHRSVKMIYIDPPYNTGSDRIYPDSFQETIKTYEAYSNKLGEDGFRLKSNSERSGRYHTDWLNMMLPRLKLARNLLTDNGVIFISIDDHEVANLRKLCDEIFGDENFCGVFIWEKKKKPSFLNANMGTVTDYIVCYAKHRPSSPPFGAGQVEDGKKYPFNNAGNSLQILTFPPRCVTFTCVDQVITKQDMSEGNIKTELLDDVRIVDGTNENEFRLQGEWRYSQAKLDSFVESEAEIIISKVPFRPNYVNRSGDLKKTANFLSHRTNNVPTNEDATEEIRQLFGADVMSHPKPSGLLKYLVRAVTDDGDVVMDFFAGSCSTAHGMWLQELEDEKRRQFVCVQLPEKLDVTHGETNKKAIEFCRKHKLPETIAEIGKERLRRTIAHLSAQGMFETKADFGFRVYKLATSNIIEWDPDANIEKSLLNAKENIKDQRSEFDVLYELLIKFGLKLDVSVEEREIKGKAVFVVGMGALVVCLDDNLDIETVEAIAALRDELQPERMRIVFKDSGFKDDVAKTNAVQILQQRGIEDIRSL